VRCRRSVVVSQSRRLGSFVNKNARSDTQWRAQSAPSAGEARPFRTVK